MKYSKPTINMPSSVKLPEIEIPLFDGNKMDWTELWNLLEVTVDLNVCLSVIEKNYVSEK